VCSAAVLVELAQEAATGGRLAVTEEAMVVAPAVAEAETAMAVVGSAMALVGLASETEAEGR
jgi:hypothetical protein